MVNKIEKIANPIYFELVDLGIINPNTISIINSKTRDKDIPVLIDETSGVIFLERQETTNEYYESKITEDRDSDKTIISLGEGHSIATASLEDDERRFQQFKSLTENANICDFGCGYGGYLQLNKDHAESISGIELKEHCKAHLIEVEPSIRVEKNIQDFDELFDVVTMFHVLEHIPGQTTVLNEICKKINTSGQLIVEVPHAQDFLIQSIDLQEFKDFSFWSEHLVLHTKESLAKILESVGFVDIHVNGYQRYSFTNHLGWFLNKSPGGHDFFSDFERRKFQKSYNNYMKQLGATDTLIATARPNYV